MIVLMVEGEGEIEAAPTLVRSILHAGLVFDPVLDNDPVSTKAWQFRNEAAFRQRLRIASTRPSVTGILALFDGDISEDAAPGQCAVDAARTHAWAAAEVGHLAFEPVLAMQEYEAWFLAALNSLRIAYASRFDPTQDFHGDPEGPRGAESALKRLMLDGAKYHKTTDQAGFSARMDIGEAWDGSRSFRRMVHAVELLATNAGCTWTTPEWAA